MKQKSALAKEEAQQLSAKLKRAENENDELETENNDLRAKQLEHNKVVAASKKADAEIGE
jgi:FtsZ-binding cell division protein ZapB